MKRTWKLEPSKLVSLSIICDLRYPLGRSEEFFLFSILTFSILSHSIGGMKLTIRQLKEKYGSFEGYVHNGCGLSSKEINLIRDIMTVPIQFEERQLYRPKI